MGKRLSLNEFIWLLILSGFSFYFSSLLLTGRISYYIHPKMILYVGFAAIIFTILAICQVSKLYNHHHENKGIKKGYILFIFPLLLGIFFSSTGLSSEAASFKGTFRIDAKYFEGVSQNNHNHSIKDGALLSGNDINVNEENYIYVLNEFIRHPEEFVGKRITFTGFAYIDKELGSDKFLSGRMMLSCCAADAQLIGFICRYNGINTLRQGEWVRVVGIFKENNKLLTKTGKLPFIEITGLEKIKEPKDKYILQ